MSLMMIVAAIVFDDDAAIRRFATTLQQQKSRVQELPGLDYRIGASISCIYACSIKNSLTRNLQLNRVDSLSAYLRPATAPAAQQHRYAGTMMLKTWHKAIAKFATVGSAGASDIFTLFTARPQILEKRIKRPAAACTSRRE
jgi:hypothetical protein